MTKRETALFVAAAILFAAAADARAQTDRSHSYAIVVGSNPGGDGQDTLKYAERDARNVAAVLRDLGGFRDRNVTLLSSPTPAQLMEAIDRVAVLVRGAAARGRQSTVFFYYSGHARSKALNLGASEVDLGALRDKILGLPATLKVVVLDACQSGAFSGVKGIEPAADFSHNSIDRLNAAGVAVMASSSATELSQESDKLGGSYFTHYLLVALRGAGDANRDGRVSLDEAYRYAYDRTLVATARTAIGRQHVTLETDLKGKGDVPLTFPTRADAALHLPAAMTAEVLIQNRDGGAVIAEVHKAKGAMRLGLAAGRYNVLVVRGESARQCDLTLPPGRTASLDDSRCPTVTLRDGLAKGPAVSGPRWTVEATLGGGATRSSDYLDRLADFGYADDLDLTPHYTLAAHYRIRSDLSLGIEVANIDSKSYLRDDDTESARFIWDTYGFLGAARYILDPFDTRTLQFFGQAAIGLGLARNRLRVGDRPPTRETDLGVVAGVGAGATVHPWTGLGLVLRFDYYLAPVMTNLLDDTHDSGGLQFTAGLRTAF